MGHQTMNLLDTLRELEEALDRLRNQARFSHDHSAFAAGAEWFADEVELIIARRIDGLDNWAPPLAGATRKHELHHLRDIIRQVRIPDKQP
jgi:hypothetical protein